MLTKGSTNMQQQPGEAGKQHPWQTQVSVRLLKVTQPGVEEAKTKNIAAYKTHIFAFTLAFIYKAPPPVWLELLCIINHCPAVKIVLNIRSILLWDRKRHVEFGLCCCVSGLWNKQKKKDEHVKWTSSPHPTWKSHCAVSKETKISTNVFLPQKLSELLATCDAIFSASLLHPVSLCLFI